MYFCYVDESGDCGAHDPDNVQRTGTPYFIVTGVFVAASKWKHSLLELKAFRRKIAREGFLHYDVEFHCAEMIDPHKVKAFTSISVAERWMLLEEYAQVIGRNTTFRIIAVVIDKRKTTLLPSEYLAAAITALYKSFDAFLKSQESFGLVFLDRANENKIHSLARKLMGTGANGETIPAVSITRIVEDPIFRVSHDSFFVQSADLVAYSLKEKEFPIASRKKFHADRIFKNQLAMRVFASEDSDPDGIIRI
jgi:hypothetical protein